MLSPVGLDLNRIGRPTVNTQWTRTVEEVPSYNLYVYVWFVWLRLPVPASKVPLWVKQNLGA